MTPTARTMRNVGKSGVVLDVQVTPLSDPVGVRIEAQGQDLGAVDDALQRHQRPHRGGQVQAHQEGPQLVALQGDEDRGLLARGAVEGRRCTWQADVATRAR